MNLFKFKNPTNAIQVFTESLRHVRMYNAIEKKNDGTMPREELEKMMRSWAESLLGLFSIDAEWRGVEPAKGPVIYTGNHISYVDIPLVMSKSPVRFVAKAELQKWPIMNSAFRRADIIFVKRESQSSRRDTLEAMKKALDEKKTICIFPSGTTDIREEKPWRRGAFQIAHDLNVPIQPFRITYKPLREVAYIDDDSFLFHLIRLSQSGRIQCAIEFHEPVYVENPELDAQKWWQWSKEISIN